MPLLQALDCFESQFVQSTAAVSDVIYNLVAHAAFPKLLEVIGDAGDRFVVRIAGEEQGDLVRPVNHAVRFHGLFESPSRRRRR